MRLADLLTALVLVALAVACMAATPRSSASPTAEPTAVASPATSRSSSPEPATSGASVAVIGDEPVLEPSVLGDYQFVLPAAAIVHEGTVHAWVVGFGAERGDQRPFHLASADGVAWTVEDGNLAEELGIEYSPPGAVPTSIHVADDGQWVMYFHGVRAPETDGGDIWRATAPGSSGPWTADPEPLLVAGAAGDWSARAVDFPSVVRTDDGYLMAFGGIEGERTSIGVATSDDEVTWSVPDEPAIPPEFCGDVDQFSAAQPRFVRDSNGALALAYLGFTTPSMRVVALARSDDGLSWSCGSQSPLLEYSDIPGSTLVHSFAAIDDGTGSPRLLFESLRPDGSELWLADVTLGP